MLMALTITLEPRYALLRDVGPDSGLIVGDLQFLLGTAGAVCPNLARSDTSWSLLMPGSMAGA